jgi:hypothetical protein
VAFLLRLAGDGTRRASVLLLGVAPLCGCQPAQQTQAQHTLTPSSSAATTLGAAGTTPWVNPVVNIAPLPVRPVQKSLPTVPAKCPPTNPNTPAPPGGPLVTCDLARTTIYTLGPEATQLMLTRVDPPRALTSGFYEVHLTMDAASASAWASFTGAHPHAHVAFVRDDLVLEAPIIEGQVTSGQVALTTQTAEAADQLAQLAGRPA